MILLIAAYSLTVIGISIWYRRHRTGDEYLMGNRNASSFLVCSALFSLVGGGDMVALTALAYRYGFSGLALFIGFSLGFCFLGTIATRARRGDGNGACLSLPEYAHIHFGPIAGYTVFVISFAAFFAMLLTQFTAGGQILSSLISLSYEKSILLTAGIATTYLFIGGFKTVMATDVVQGASRLLLMPLIVVVAGKAFLNGRMTIGVQSLPPALWLSLIVTGFFASAASADVWQRIYAASDDRAARNGLFGGAAVLMVFGLTLVGLGIVAKQAPSIATADQAFSGAMTTLLPPWAMMAAVVLVLSTIMSTADTEIFLLSGMAVREILRLRGEFEPKAITRKQSIVSTRIALIVIAGVSVALSFRFREITPIYTWLLSAILVMAPTVLASLLFAGAPAAATWSLILNTLLFLSLSANGLLTPETAYVIVVPGILVYAIGYVLLRKTSSG